MRADPLPLTIRPAKESELTQIMQLIDHSRSIMRANGNFSQWGGYPGADLIESDIAHGIGHAVIEPDPNEGKDGRMVGYFALLRTPEPTYTYIEEGQWLDDTTPYGTIHRLACAAGVHGIAQCVFEWAERQCASVRVDTHLDNHIMLHIIQRHGYTRCGVVYMRDGSPREAFQKMMYPMVNSGLKGYVEAEILPRYDHFDTAHKRDHVERVMAQSMELASHYAELDKEMVYTIAAYHDTGVVEGRERHHLVSGRIMREDERLKEWFTAEQIETMAQAAEDHRASSTNEPRSLYGKIVAEADRDIEPTTIVRRTVQYGLSHYPELDREAQWERTLQHLDEKYAEGGYLKLYIPESRNARQLERLRQLIQKREEVRKIFEQEVLNDKTKQGQS